MPWQPKEAKRKTHKANTPKKQRQWSDVANSVLAKTGDEGRAVREANAVVKRNHSGQRKRAEVEAHSFNWRRGNLNRGQ
jgi:hypothetical protein